MKIKIILLFLLSSSLLFSQSMILKGHLINEKTEEPISKAKIYILGGDSEDQTTTFGEYRLNLKLDGSYDIGDEVEVYIRHEVYGFHKETIPILKSLQYDIKIEPDNVAKIIGTLLDSENHEPIENIEVSLISEENIALIGDELLTTNSDKYGGYSFLISKSLIGNQRYAKLKFFDPNRKGYNFKEAVVNIMSPQSIYLQKKNEDSEFVKKQFNESYSEPTEAESKPFKLTPVESAGYGTIDFDSGNGVKRYEFRYSPNKNDRGKPIISGSKVKLMSTKKNQGIDWYEIEYNGHVGWIEAKYVNK